MTRRPRHFAQLVALALMAATAALTVRGSDPPAVARADDDDDAEFRRAEGWRSIGENCLMCHGEDLIARQRLTAKQWAAEVEKMVNWGAPLPPERRQPVVDLLAETYPDTQPPAPPTRITVDQALALDPQPSPVTALAGSDPGRGGPLFADHCASCHGALARGGDLGVNLVEKPVLLRDDEFRSLLKDGRRRMPGFSAVLDDRAQGDLLAWLRRQR